MLKTLYLVQLNEGTCHCWYKKLTICKDDIKKYMNGANNELSKILDVLFGCWMKWFGFWYFNPIFCWKFIDF